MKKMMMKSLVVLMMVAAFALVSLAQSNSKIIKFPSGKNTVTEKFTLNGDDGIAYMLKNLKQYNLVKFSVGGLYTNGVDAQGLEIKLRRADNWDDTLAEATPGEDVEYQVQKGDGDYEIVVMNPGKRKANITFTVTLNGESADSDVCAGCDNPNDADAERLKFAKGQSDVDLDLQIEGRETKKYVAYVGKGYMTCIVPATNLGTGVTIKVNGKVLNPNVSTCTAHSTTAGDQIIEFINNGNKEKGFSVTLGFHQH